MSLRSSVGVFAVCFPLFFVLLWTEISPRILYILKVKDPIRYTTGTVIFVCKTDLYQIAKDGLN